MTAGKNKLLRYCRLYVNGGDLSGDSRTFGMAQSSMEEIDMTGWTAAAFRSYIPEPTVNVALRGYQAMMNDDTNQSFQQLKDAGVTGMEVSLVFGGGGEPSAGDPAYLLAASQFSSRVTIDNKSAILTAELLPDPNVIDHLRPYGVVLMPLQAVSGGVTGATINNLAATTGAWHAHLHVCTLGGTYQFKLRHSTNGSSWADLATFTLNGSAVGSERLSGTGTVNQYRRIEVTQSVNGACVAVCTFATQ